MISRDHRFHGYASLRFVYQHGQVVRGQFCALKYVKHPRRSSYRAAVVVGRKVHKSAVVRNRLRRRVYEAMRTNEASIIGPYDLVFTIFDARLNDLLPTELQAVIHAMLAQAGVAAALPAVDR